MVFILEVAADKIATVNEVGQHGWITDAACGDKIAENKNPLQAFQDFGREGGGDSDGFSRLFEILPPDFEITDKCFREVDWQSRLSVVCCPWSVKKSYLKKTKSPNKIWHFIWTGHA